MMLVKKSEHLDHNAFAGAAMPASPPMPAQAVAPAVANRWAVLAVVTVGTFMTTLDASIVNISLPSIASAFGVSLTGTIEWIIIGYLVVIAALLLTVGRAFSFS